MYLYLDTFKIHVSVSVTFPMYVSYLDTLVMYLLQV